MRLSKRGVRSPKTLTPLVLFLVLEVHGCPSIHRPLLEVGVVSDPWRSMFRSSDFGLRVPASGTKDAKSHNHAAVRCAQQCNGITEPCLAGQVSKEHRSSPLEDST